MPKIELETKIKGDIFDVFDLARNIDFHKLSASKTKEEAIAGKTSGLIGLNESVTWKATHFGVRQKLTSKITKFNRPISFTDEMQNGAFKSFKHEHKFSEENGFVVMVDIFEYESPLGFIGQIANRLFLNSYMTKFLIERNTMLKRHIENQHT